MNLLNIFQIIIAVFLITTILLQQRGAGLGSAFGGEGNIYSTKRGIEKILFRASITLVVIFLVSCLVNLFI